MDVRQEVVERATELEQLRAEIEVVDAALLELLARRVALARRVGDVKLRLGVLFVDPAQEAAVVRRAASGARPVGLPDEGVRRIFWNVIDLCRGVQLQARDGAAQPLSR